MYASCPILRQRRPFLDMIVNVSILLRNFCVFVFAALPPLFHELIAAGTELPHPPLRCRLPTQRLSGLLSRHQSLPYH